MTWISEGELNPFTPASPHPPPALPCLSSCSPALHLRLRLPLPGPRHPPSLSRAKSLTSGTCKGLSRPASPPGAKSSSKNTCRDGESCSSEDGKGGGAFTSCATTGVPGGLDPKGRTRGELGSAQGQRHPFCQLPTPKVASPSEGAHRSRAGRQGASLAKAREPQQSEPGWTHIHTTTSTPTLSLAFLLLISFLKEKGAVWGPSLSALPLAWLPPAVCLSSILGPLRPGASSA